MHFGLIIRFVLQKNRQKFNSRKLKKGSEGTVMFFEFSTTVSADVRSFIPAKLNQAGYESVLGAFIKTKKLG